MDRKSFMIGALAVLVLVFVLLATYLGALYDSVSAELTIAQAKLSSVRADIEVARAQLANINYIAVGDPSKRWGFVKCGMLYLDRSDRGEVRVAVRGKLLLSGAAYRNPS